MTETPLEQLVDERAFAGTLQRNSEAFFRLSNTLLGRAAERWNKRHFFQLINEAEALESFLDDFGARTNREYSFFTELVASLRGFAHAAYSGCHLEARLESYGIADHLGDDGAGAVLGSLQSVRAFLSSTVHNMLDALRSEANRLGLEITPESFPEASLMPLVARERLPRNVGDEEINEEEKKIAEVASKFLLACEMIEGTGVRQIEDPEERRKLLGRVCTEERARVYKATVHNLQSTYDTYVKSTVLETRDPRLGRLRGFASATLHVLEMVTQLTHFYERHEADIRSEAAKQRIAELVDRSRVQHHILNDLMFLAVRLMRQGRSLAEELLPSYTNAQVLEVQLADDLMLHARPAALIVSIVNNYGTPVEMEVAGKRCNAASILELLVTVGSNPDARKFVFQGDENPLRDIALLFQHGLGERGLENLPAELGYLREGQG